MDEQHIVPTVIRNLDLTTVRERLIQKEGWTTEYADRLVEEYREYLALFYFHPGEELVPPTRDLDDVWHEHILDTQRYSEDCRKVFGRFIHHVPGLEQGTDRHTEGLQRTRRHWWQRFGRERRDALSLRPNESGVDTVTLGSSCTSYMPPAHEHSSFFHGWFSGGHSGGAGAGGNFDDHSAGGDGGHGGAGGDSGGGDGGGGGGCGGGG